MERADASRAPVLLTGETGTGKNVIARAIHELEGRHNAPFVDINCAALPDNLIEAELFGHERGAFTGADEVRRGVFELADSGTLFLDEIAELPLRLQAKLLGVLDDGRLRRIGGENSRRVNVRIIAATNAELEQRSTSGRFRSDLYFRLSVLRIHLPPLRKRLQDLIPLCDFFLQELAPDIPLEIGNGEMERLANYTWPGNVRELRNVVERAVILRDSNSIHPSALLHDLLRDSSGSTTGPKDKVDMHEPATLLDVEKRHIATVLNQLQNNHSRAAKALGISRSTLIRKLDRYQLR